MPLLTTPEAGFGGRAGRFRDEFELSSSHRATAPARSDLPDGKIFLIMALRTPPPSPEDRAEVTRRAGLCAACANLQVLRSKRSVFVRCSLADSDPAFPRYPQLPIYRCLGFRAVEPEAEEGER